MCVVEVVLYLLLSEIISLSQKPKCPAKDVTVIRVSLVPHFVMKHKNIP